MNRTMKRSVMILGYVMTYLLTSGFAFLSLVATQAMTGNESWIALFLGYVLGWFVLYRFGGSLPRAIADAKQSFGANFLGFGAGGALAGGLIVVWMAIDGIGALQCQPF